LQLGADQRDRLLTTTERINQSGEKIKESRRQLVETEELGVNILQDVQLQHQTLLRTQQTVGTTSSDSSLYKVTHHFKVEYCNTLESDMMFVLKHARKEGCEMLKNEFDARQNYLEPFISF